MENRVNNKQEQRRFSMEDKFMKNIKINDILYGAMHSMSYFVNNEKIVYLSDFNKNKKLIKEWSGIKDNRTFNTQINNMIAAELIELTTRADKKGVQKEVYLLKENMQDKYVLIPLDMLKYLLQGTSKGCLKAYCYLYFKNNPNSNDCYFFTLPEIAAAIGYKSYGAKQKELVEVIIDVLQKVGAIAISEAYRNDGVNTYRGFYLRFINDTPFKQKIEQVEEQEQVQKMSKEDFMRMWNM